MAQNVPFNFNVNVYDKILILSLSPPPNATKYHTIYRSKNNTKPIAPGQGNPLTFAKAKANG